MVIRHHISFRLRPSGDKSISYLIQMHVTFSGYRLKITTGCQLPDHRYWDSSSQRVSADYISEDGITAASINGIINNAEQQMDWCFKYFEVNDTFPTVADLKSKYCERMGIQLREQTPIVYAKEDNTLLEVFDEYTRDCGEKNAWTEATFEKMAALQEDLISFKSDISFEDLDENGLTAFVRFLREEKVLKTPRKIKVDNSEEDDRVHIGVKNSTIDKKLGYLRMFLNWASARGYNENMVYKTFRPKLKQTQKKVIYLTKEELARVRSLKIPEEKIYLETVRDIFLFCCFSGLRHSDVNNLRNNDVKEDHLEVTTIKTADSIQIELNEVTRAILQKYSIIHLPNNKALPNYTNQAMNRDLKELCKMAGINEVIRITTYRGNLRIDEIHPKYELVGTHTGRRTFIVNALSLGIPPNVVMKWTGHSDYKSMKPYIDIVDSTKAESMAKMDTLL